MSERPRQRIDFGLGLDRETGVGLVDPVTFEDLRNVDLTPGRLTARRGLEARTALSLGGLGVTPMTHVVAVHALRAVGQSLFLGYENASRKLQVFSAASTGLNPVYRAEWGILGADAGIPQVMGVESKGVVLLAHSHADLSKRLATQYYTPATGVLAGLTANLDNTTAKAVKFRGVAAHLDYVIGWGFGTDSDADRPEIVRVNLPGEPLTWRPEHYWMAGVRGEPVVAGLALRGTFLVAKENQLYLIRGTSRDTFGIHGPIDEYYGFAGSHLGIVVGGTCFFWSLEGPRATEGAASTDIGFPLDLGGPRPEDLAASGALATGFVNYLPNKQVVEFIFGQRAYVLPLRARKQPTWSYREFGVELRCAGLIFVGSGTAAPAGYPDITTLVKTASTVTVPWDNIAPVVGDETVELWLKVGAGAYAKVRDLAVEAGVTQEETLTSADGITPGTLCKVALRFRRGLSFTAGYTSTNPDDWPVASRASVTTDAGATAPTDLFISDAQIETFGPKSYLSFRFTIGRGEFSLGSLSEVLSTTSATPPTADALPLWSGSSSQTVTDFIGGYLQQPTPSYRWFWVRHKLSDGTPSAVFALAENPVDVSSGWAL